MLSFRQKILIANLAVIAVFLLLMYPLASKSVQSIIYNVLDQRATELSKKIQKAKDIPQLIKLLNREKANLFFRVSIITSNHGVIYDTHARKILRKAFQPGFVSEHPEVEDALRYGTGYSEGFSKLLQQNLTYVAKRFTSHNNTYVIRTAFPCEHIDDITEHVIFGFLLLGITMLLLYSLMTWFIIHHITNPIQKIIQAIKPYQEEKRYYIPEIKLNTTSPHDDFYKLAYTLNSLSQRVKNQIDTLVQERNEKEAVLESLDEGVLAVDDKMIITYANKVALKILSLEKEKILYHNFSCIDKPDFYDLLTTCQNEETTCKTTATIGKHPKYYLFIVAIPKGKEKGAILVLQDKSSHYRMLEMRKDFIANASHELKTPITIIQGFAEALHDNPELPKDTSSEITRKIVYNCQRMTAIITNLLTLADIENLPRSRLQKCNLSHIIENCYHDLMGVYPDAVVEIKKLTEDTSLIVDPDLLEVAIRNLFDNAAKYSESSVKITVTLDKQDSNHLKIAIADEGIGIPKNKIEYIFERFYTINKSSPCKMKSSGLGLSIVKTIIEKHLGKIFVSSEQGKGTTFTIFLPTDLSESH